MSKIKVAELFYSIQGEGRHMGVPSIFLRTFGCNFTCSGFGMPKGMKSTEADRIVEANKVTPYKSYNDLPLVSTGCDSYASWHPEFKNLSPMLETEVIVDQIMELLPYKSWQDEHLVITGGEPLLGWQRSYPDLLSHPKMVGLSEMTFETNGTQELTDDFKKYLFENWGHRKDKLTFSVSPKLSVSGEDAKDAICPEIVTTYEWYGNAYLKFVITNKEDAEEAAKAVESYRAAGFKGPVYLMPVGGVESVYSLNNRTVAELAMKMGVRYSDRLQVPLFKNAWGT
jgi:7-carboxy-7-deazaguanine synthase